MATPLGMKKQVQAPYDQVLARLPELLKAEGFGIITEIDVTGTLKQKIGVEFRRYRILGACAPQIAHQVLSRVPDAGVLLPCNLAVYEEGTGTVVTAADPLQTLAAARPELTDLAQEARSRLARVLEKLS
jgi:uncharacterized protein (DUF302 family)